MPSLSASSNDNGRLQVRSSDGALRVAGDITAFIHLIET